MALVRTSGAAVFVVLCGTAAVTGHPCAPCHAKQVEAFSTTPMARSVTHQPRSADVEFRHAASGTRFTIKSKAGAMTQRMERRGYSATYPVEFSIGSGAHAEGFVFRVGKSLFQSPVAAYRSRSRWDMAPGYETMIAPDANRRVTPECLLCHASTRGETAEPITCDRCHGDTAAHLTNPSANTIVNPARLKPEERDSICEQCHLNGEARVPNPGMSFSDFRPGKRMEEFFSVFVRGGASGSLKVVSHAEQLAQSACQRATLKLWCGTCHAPHGPAIQVSAVCRQCHSSLTARHPDAAESCANCHMPKRRPDDGGHTAFTDHRIQRRAGEPSEHGTLLRAWRPAAAAELQKRNLGLACVIAGERERSAALLNEGHRLLAEVFPKFPRDPDVLASLGMVLYLKDQYADAITLLTAAAKARVSDPSLLEKLAVVLRAAGQTGRAAQALEGAIRLDPSRETAYHLLASMQLTEENRRRILRRYLDWNPQSIVTREALARFGQP